MARENNDRKKKIKTSFENERNALLIQKRSFLFKYVLNES